MSRHVVALVAALAAVGCLERPSNPVVDGPPGRHQALQVANQVFDEFGIARVSMSASITWMAGDCLETPEVDNCSRGMEFGPPCEIYLLTYDTWAESAFAHEVVHCSIGDPDHEWFWWPFAVRLIGERLAAAGL